ncbi:MAG: LamG domain-containing protein, partial [Planctomycetota bacterium]
VESFDGFIDNLDPSAAPNDWNGFVGYQGNPVAQEPLQYLNANHYTFSDYTNLKGTDRQMKVDLYTDDRGEFFFFERIEENPFVYNPDAGKLYSALDENDGVITGGVTQIAGRVGNGSMQFDGVDGIITVADNANIDLGTGQYTISAWIKYDSGTNEGKNILKKFNTVGYELETGLSTNQDYVGVYVAGSGGSNSKDTAPTAVGDSSWNLVTFTFDGTNGTMYLNGVNAGSVNMSTVSDLYNTGDLYIGGDNISAYFNGAIDDLRIYKRALTGGFPDSEISSLYSMTDDSDDFIDRDLAAHYTFEDPEFIYDQLAYAGITSDSVPTDGIYVYGNQSPASPYNSYGRYLMVSEFDPDGTGGVTVTQGPMDADAGEMTVGINFKNRRVIGSFHHDHELTAGDHHDDDANGVIFFGDVDASGNITATAFKQIRKRELGAEFVVMEGSLGGKLYGAEHQGIGLQGQGTNNMNIANTYDALNWNATGAAFKSSYDSESDTADIPTTLQFNAGHIALMTTDLSSGAKTFIRSTSDSGINMQFNTDAGIITAGGLNGTEYNISGGATSNVLTASLGHATDTTQSAFVSPDLYVSLITGGQVVTTSDIQTDRSYIFAFAESYDSNNDTFDDKSMADYPWISMGEISLNYIAGTNKWAAQPFSHFVAGVKADFSAVSENITNINVVGTYVGPAMASYFCAGSGNPPESLHGTSSMTIDFASASVTSGSINLQSHDSPYTHTLTVNSGAITVNAGGLSAATSAFSNWTMTGANGFNATPSGSSTLNASFYDANDPGNPISATKAPASVGGNFSAMHNNGSTHIIQGVFAGNK